MLVVDKHRIFQGFFFHGALKKGGRSLLDIIFTLVVVGSLGNPQVALTNLLRQIRVEMFLAKVPAAYCGEERRQSAY